MKRLGALLALAAAVAGCDTVRNARLEQRSALRYARLSETNTVPDRVLFAGFMLPDFVTYATENRPDMIQARLAVSNAVLAVRTVQADGPLVPHVETSAGYSRRTNNGKHFSLEKMDGDPTGAVGLDFLVYDFGRTDAAEAEARENLGAAHLQLRQTALAVFREVAQAYFSLLEADAKLEAAHTNEYKYAEHLRQAEAMFAAEEAKKLDVLRARVDLSDARLATIVASNDQVVATATFMQALGIKTDEGCRDDVLPRRSDCLYVAVQELDESAFPDAEALHRARETSPELAYRRAKLRAASANVDWRIADLYPSVSFDASLSFTDRIWNFSWAGKALQSVYLGYRKTTAVEQAVVALKSAQAELLAAEQTLSGELAKAVASRDSARKELVAAHEKLRQAQENLATAEAQWRLGDMSRVDYSDAVKLYVEALGERAAAFYAGQRAEAALFSMVGVSPIYVENRVADPNMPRGGAQ